MSRGPFLLRALLGLVGLWAVLTAGGCPSEPSPVDAFTYEVPDAGDEAFVKRATLLLWGRRPVSLFELRALMDVVEQSDRPTLIRAMTRSRDYTERWQQWVWDALGVNREGLPFNLDPVTLQRCFNEGASGPDDGALARFVRDTAPGDGAWDAPFTMHDLVRSALIEDDLSVVYRANLFPFLRWEMVPSGIVEAALQRQSRYEIFERTYLHRSSVCLTCHHSEWSVTGSDDPALDRTWEVPGHFERALFGEPAGPEDIAELHVLFRRWGVIHEPAFLGEQMALGDPDGVVLINGCMSQGPAVQGCDGCPCEQAVCDADPTCCTGQWDMECAQLCTDSGFGCSAPLPNDFEGCGSVVGGSGGCGGCACEAEVCAENELCCSQSWGDHCAFACALAQQTDCAPVPQDEALRPWGMNDRCGLLAPLAELRPDEPTGLQTYFGGDLGGSASVHDIEAMLRTGTAAMDGPGLAVGADLAVAPDEALVWMTAANIAAQVWREAIGARLTIANYFPRNVWQRDLLTSLGDAFVRDGWSLRELLVAVTSHPLFNAAPSAQLDQGAYPLPPVVDPFTADAEDPAARGNGPGELVHRHSARVLVRAAYRALDWSEPETFVYSDHGEGDVVLSTGMGAFRTDKNQGFDTVDFQSLLVWEEALGGCDFRSLQPGEDEWFDGLMDAISTHNQAEPASPATWGDVASAIKERLLTDPDVSDPAERGLMESVLGASFGDPVPSTAGGVTAIRRLCGALLSSPQFLLAGNMGPNRAPGAAARLHAPGDDFATHCAAVAALLPGRASCASDALSLSD